MPGGYVGARPKDLSSLSDKPSQIKNRLKRARKRAEKTGDDTDYQWEFNRLKETGGIKPIEDWDLAELAHGMPRHSDGKFRGVRPSWITPEVTREIKKRLYNETFAMIGSNADLAVQTIIKLMTSDEVDFRGKPLVDARTRLDAAKYVIDHILGKAEKIVTFDATDGVREMFAAAIVLEDGFPQGHLEIEGEVVEDTELTADDDA